MSTPLIPQEIYLLERYSSLEYFGLMRDAWEAMVRHCEDCLQRFMRNLPADYRRRPQPLQPDVVWGELVIRNFRGTMLDLFDSYIELSHGDANALNSAHRVVNDVRGQREFSTAWFDEVEAGAEDKFYELRSRANRYAANIWPTSGAYWAKGELSYDYDVDARGPLPDVRWPRYQLNAGVTVKTDDSVPQTGIYLPLVDDSCAQFLIAGEPADKANVGYDSETMQNVSREFTQWILVERVPGEFVDDPLADLLRGDLASGRVERVPAGQPCPVAGWWYTPAEIDSRRWFKEGELFPEIEGSDYGDTFWLRSPG